MMIESEKKIELIKVIDLETEEKARISQRISEINSLLNEKCQSYGFDRGRQLRDYYFKQKKSDSLFFGMFDQKIIDSLEEMIQLEEKILSGFVKMAQKLSLSFWKLNRGDRPHLDKCDYFQQATWAVFDSIYGYDGSTEFSTYCYVAIKRRLLAFVRDEEIHSGIGREVKLIRRKIKKLMRENSMSFDQAMEEIEKTENISETVRCKVKTSCYNVKCINDFEFDFQQPQRAISGDVELLLKAIESVKFNSLQRELISSYLKTGSRIDADLVRERINPNTGRNYTRQAVSQHWVIACEKIKEVMDAA